MSRREGWIKMGRFWQRHGSGRRGQACAAGQSLDESPGDSADLKRFWAEALLWQLTKTGHPLSPEDGERIDQPVRLLSELPRLELIRGSDRLALFVTRRSWARSLAEDDRIAERLPSLLAAETLYHRDDRTKSILLLTVDGDRYVIADPPDKPIPDRAGDWQRPGGADSTDARDPG